MLTEPASFDVNISFPISNTAWKQTAGRCFLGSEASGHHGFWLAWQKARLHHASDALSCAKRCPCMFQYNPVASAVPLLEGVMMRRFFCVFVWCPCVFVGKRGRFCTGGVQRTCRRDTYEAIHYRGKEIAQCGIHARGPLLCRRLYKV